MQEGADMSLYHLYKHFGADDELLYVGISTSALKRFGSPTF
jgi:hypothetical protein